ncbi:hypothetical protein HDU96_002879, partial [Phlyctochytrium bullatum]
SSIPSTTSPPILAAASGLDLDYEDVPLAMDSLWDPLNGILACSRPRLHPPPPGTLRHPLYPSSSSASAQMVKAPMEAMLDANADGLASQVQANQVGAAVEIDRVWRACPSQTTSLCSPWNPLGSPIELADDAAALEAEEATIKAIEEATH